MLGLDVGIQPRFRQQINCRPVQTVEHGNGQVLPLINTRDGNHRKSILVILVHNLINKFNLIVGDFFDTKHKVVLGGSWATHPRIAGRRTFRNWYQSGYGFAWAGGRVVKDVIDNFGVMPEK